MYSGYITLAYLWARMAEVAQQKIDEGSDDPIYPAKIKTADFYFQRILPRTAMHRDAMLSGVKNLMAVTAEEL